MPILKEHPEPAKITRRTKTSVDARCSLCPGVMILWQDRAKHLDHAHG